MKISEFGLSNPPQRTYHQFSQPHQPSIYFSSQFDNGNMHQVRRNAYDHYSIWTASDCQGTQNQGYPKSWFYFRVGGFKNRRITFSIHRVHFLWAMSKRNHLYRPVYRFCKHSETNQIEQITEWSRLPHPIISLGMNQDNELVLKFDYSFYESIKWVQFAFIYPYGHDQCLNDLHQLREEYQNSSEICFKHYEMCKTVQGRTISLVIISSHQGKEGYENIKVDNVLTFGGQKIIKFRNNKPIIFISARVHPIQTPSSFTMKGIINFLLNKNDLRAHLLRKYFVFVLVPMLNPDGVSNGHCRMDTLNQNLNRYYKNPDPNKQPSCYSVKRLCQHYNKDKRIFMYLDLHAHPAYKGNFLFGNAIFDYIQQVQSQLFPKILSQNCVNFQFQQCNFSRKHMKAKDRFEDMNKQGCGRVVFYKDFGIGHSYTLECGYHCNTFDNMLLQHKDQHKQYKVKFKQTDKGEKIYETQQKIYSTKTLPSKQIVKEENYDIFTYTDEPLDHNNSEHYKQEIVFFEQKTYQNLGKNILISILDIWNKNPYSRVTDINDLRKEIAEKQSKLDRFRKEQAGIKTKKKKIIQLIEEQFYGNWHKRNVMMVQTQEEPRRRTHFSLGKTQQKVKRVEKSNAVESSKFIGNSTNIASNQVMPQILIKEKQIQLYQYKQDIKQQFKQISCLPSSSIIGSNQISIKMNYLDNKTIFRPLGNMRIRNLLINK